VTTNLNQTTGETPRERKDRRLPLAMATIAALGVAAALGTGFVLGRGGNGEANTVASGAVLAASASGGVDGAAHAPVLTGAAPQAAEGQPAGPTDAPSDGGAQGQAPGQEDDAPVPTDTPEPAVTEEPDDPTPEPEPDDPCPFCVDGGVIVIPSPEPPVNPCPMCLKPGFAMPADTTPPVIADIGIESCGVTLTIDFKVDGEAEVWVSYEHLGDPATTPHQDVEYQAVVEIQMDWAFLLNDYVYVHAMDLAGNHAQSGPIEIPPLDLGC
jgi:hypothetical protein